jgi:rhodanese-related sulfurtransferase
MNPAAMSRPAPPDVDQRPEKHEDPEKIPRPLDGVHGMVVVDTTWGEISPIDAGSGVRTVGELEVIAHLRAGKPLVDTRLVDSHVEATIPGATNLPHEEIGEAIGELDRDEETVFFCNGPQCTATPDAIGKLLELGYPPRSILWYRGGMHDWVTLGLPTSAPSA